MKVANCLKMVVIKMVTYDNFFPLRHWVLLLERQVNYVEDVVVTRDTANLGMSRKELIQVISEIGNTDSYAQA